MVRGLRAAAFATALCAAQPALAAGTGGCDSFEWPLTTELSWVKAADAAEVESGAKLASPPAKAINLKLEPAATAKLAIAPSGKPKSAAKETFAGVVTFDGVAKPSLHQVTLAAGAWVDVVQNGATLPDTAHTGKTDCDGIRKSVRFNIGPGTFAVQISGAESPAIRLTVTPSD